MEPIRVIGEKQSCGGPGRFFLGRAEELGAELAEKYAGTARLIYLDPPFGTGDTFSMRVGAGKNISVPVYEDKLDEEAYLAMMRAVLGECKRLLSADGSLYLHVDYRKSAQMRILLDEIFGAENFVNEIIWAYKSGGRSTKHFSYKHDNILLYKKSAKHYFNIKAAGVPRGPERRNHMKRSIDENGRICYSIRSAGKTYTYYEDGHVYPSDVWDDIEHLHQRDPERTGYSTQKPEALLKRIIEVSSEKGDLVVDLFSGSATTAAAAAKTEREWIAADASALALSTLRRRLLTDNRNCSLLGEVKGMTLSYELNDLKSLDITIGERDGCVYVKPPENTALGYMALGSVENSYFTPWIYELSPNADSPLCMAKSAKPVLQAVDLFGRQGFWKL